jgi:hypothetical protein
MPPDTRTPKPNRLSREKLEKQYTFGDRWFSGTHPLNFGEKIRHYLDQHLIIMNLINDALVRLFPRQKNAFGDSNTFLAFQDDPPWAREVWKRHLENLTAFKDLAAAHQARLLVVLIPTNTQVTPFWRRTRASIWNGPTRFWGGS